MSCGEECRGEHDNSFFFLFFRSKSVLETLRILRILKLLPHLNSCVSQEEEAERKEEDEIDIDKKNYQLSTSHALRLFEMIIGNKIIRDGEKLIRKYFMMTVN